MWTNVQFTGTLGPGASGLWYTFGWPVSWQTVWYMMPTTPLPGAPEVGWSVEVERSDPNNCTYWITVHNLTSQSMDFEARYAVLG
ncbi:hypothetical protein acdb102_35030 [Acidothermaceae bacterium B102]|nr:hypothetical protein acdb102_35030 [Acidothermaceae bacterium B102]